MYLLAQLFHRPQESAYNIGRAAHGLGLNHIAVAYYERALREPPSKAQAAAASASSGDGCDVRREAAYNLSLIYRASGSDDLARQLLRQYCTV